MKKKATEPEMLAEYDFSGGVRGKYAQRFAAGTNIVLIDPDLLEFFPNQESVNNALRGLVTIIKRQQTGKAAPAHVPATRRRPKSQS